MSKCQCLQDDEQSDQNNTTEQFCGYQKDGIYYACSKSCGQCDDKDPKKCNNGCPTLNQPAKPSSDRTPKTKKKKPKKPDAPSAPKKTRWWIWPLVVLILLLVVGGVIFIVGSPSTPSAPNTSAPTVNVVRAPS